ncbi:hypothetical protein QKU58_gp063 [Pyramimonas orientalis virus]|uniref:Fungal lipase-type domain-containing protein n=1 Tax=Pyramimonas orientalis virus 01B TaxID=3134525 RepID=A0A7M3UNK5_9VIRU|nr:hypothetical protein QKU58_gp063 [Pyramimonas orientalis virus]QOI90268.1 hypothetical protein HWQ62_00131 [Pyramimonas orientalis virus]
MNLVNSAQYKPHIHGAKLCRQLYDTPNKNTLIEYNKKRKDLFVVLQGTNSICHWVHNVSVIPTKHEGVHSGFKSFAKLCRKELLDDLATVTSENGIGYNDIDTIYFTSHSLGGSATIILIYEMLQNIHFKQIFEDKNIDIVLFGAPMSGNTTFINKFQELLRYHKNVKIYRYNMRYDVIKHYPSILTYSHVCDDIVVEGNTTNIFDILYNHSINCYIDNLDNINCKYKL